MEVIVSKSEVPPLPAEIRIQCAGSGSLPSLEIRDISERGVQDIVEKVRSGAYPSLYLAPDAEGEEGFLMLESSPELIFLQIWEAESETAWACFDPDLLDSDEDAPIAPSDGQSVFPMRNTMRDRKLAAACVEWYIHTAAPYPGMDWMKMY